MGEGREGREGERVAGVYGLQMWRYGVFGRGRVCLNPLLAGWHRGEEEVRAPQHSAQKAERVVRARSEIIGTQTPAPLHHPLPGKRSQSHVYVQDYTNISHGLRESTEKKRPSFRPDEFILHLMRRCSASKCRVRVARP